MKLFFLTFTIALMVQGFVATPISRHKRNDLFVETFQETVKVIKQLMPGTEVLFKNSLKEIPKTPNYAKYVQLIEEYLAEMQEYKKNSGNCFEKNMGMMEKFVNVMEEINKDFETPEVKEIDRILESNGGEELVKDFEEFGAKLSNPEVEKAMEDISPVDALRIAPIIMEVC